jgi:hypothetical protein
MYNIKMKLIIVIIIENKDNLSKIYDLLNKYQIEHFIFSINEYKNIFKFVNNKIFDWVFIAFDNSFIHIQNLIKYLQSQNHLLDYPCYIGGHGDNRVLGKIKFYFHSYTPGICLNKKAINLLLDDKIFTNYNNLCEKYNSDLVSNYGVAIGFFATIYNFKIVNNDEIWYCNCWGSPCHPNKPKLNTLVSCSNMTLNQINYCVNIFLYNNDSTITLYPSGGLGNLLFQYFYGYTISSKVKSKLQFITNTNYWRGDMNKYKIFDNCNFIDESFINLTDQIRINERNSYYDPLEIEPKKNYIIYGYFQSYKYFINKIKEIKKDLFNNIKIIYESIKQSFYNKYKNKEICMIHVRRGDYLKYPKIHPVCSNTYYSLAINFINNENIKYLVYSDDINFVTNWKLLKDFDYEIINENDPIKTLIMMTLSNHFIIANSTLSLCAYFLRENYDSTLIGPKNWFGPDAPPYKLEDILPEETILL